MLQRIIDEFHVGTWSSTEDALKTFIGNVTVHLKILEILESGLMPQVHSITLLPKTTDNFKCIELASLVCVRVTESINRTNVIDQEIQQLRCNSPPPKCR